MRQVLWEDERGYKHLSLLRDNDPDTDAHKGIPVGVPDVEQINWDDVKRDLHNFLVERRLHEYQDVIQSQNGLDMAVRAALKRRLALLYRMQEMEDNE